MARTIQVITKEGGKITNVIAATAAVPMATAEPIEDSKKGNKSKRK